VILLLDDYSRFILGWRLLDVLIAK
jgi:hypothetical protein